MLDQLNSNTITIAHDLSEFLATGHQHCQLVSDETRQAIRDVVRVHPLRPVRPLQQPPIRPRTGARSRSSSLLQPYYPTDWSIDKALFRRVVQQFKADVADYWQPEDSQRTHYPPDEGDTEFIDRFFNRDDSIVTNATHQSPIHQSPTRRDKGQDRTTGAGQGLRDVLGPILSDIDRSLSEDIRRQFNDANQSVAVDT